MSSKQKRPTLDDLLLTGAELTGLTGLTDRRHRQLATAGYFPPPHRGCYQSSPTITGMFKFYRDQIAKRDEALRNEQLGYTKAKRLIAEEELSELRKQVLPKAEIGPLLYNLLVSQRSIIQRRYEQDLHNKIDGLTKQERFEEFKKATDDYIAILKEGAKDLILEPAA